MECPRCAEENNKILTKFVDNINNIIYRSVLCENCKLIFNTEEKSELGTGIRGRVYAIKKRYDANKRRRIDENGNKTTTIERITTVYVYNEKKNKSTEINIKDYEY